MVRRWVATIALVGATLAAPACPPFRVRAEGCPGAGELYRITGYSRYEFGDFTADGTSIFSEEAIAAGSYNLPLGSRVWVQGVGAYRIADRGRLGDRHLDIAVWDRAEAFRLTGWSCVWRIG